MRRLCLTGELGPSRCGVTGHPRHGRTRLPQPKAVRGKKSRVLCADSKPMRLITYSEEQGIEENRRCPAMTMMKCNKAKMSGRQAKLGTSVSLTWKAPRARSLL